MAAGQNRRTALELYKINPEDVKKSQKWFDEQVRKLSTKKVTPNRIMNEEGMHLTSTLVPGKMYFFYYHPKHYETLPHYDQFPLVLPFAKTGNSFTGLNLHYLDYKMRMGLFQQLLKTANQTTITAQNKIRYSWDMIKSVQKLAPARACVKMYLDDHVKSPFCEIQPEFWHTAIMLPVQRFVGESKESIWAQNRKFK